jgi:hypothetical protein
MQIKHLDFCLLLHIDPPRLSLSPLSLTQCSRASSGAPVRRWWRTRKWSTSPTTAKLQRVGHVPDSGDREALTLGGGTRKEVALRHSAELLPCGEGRIRPPLLARPLGSSTGRPAGAHLDLVSSSWPEPPPLQP